MQQPVVKYDKDDVLCCMNYEDQFDQIFYHVASRAFDETDIVSGLLVMGIYPTICRNAAANAGIRIGMHPYESVRIYLIFKALVFEKKKRFIDRLLGRKKNMENIYVTMCNKAEELYLNPNEASMPDWAEAYIGILEDKSNRSEGN